VKQGTIPPLPGDRAGPYRLISSIGVGGMATVFKAEGPFGLVAVKILHPSRVTTEELKRFQRE
jgi:serine/threonine protein kinase